MPVSTTDHEFGTGDEVELFQVATIFYTVVAAPNEPLQGALDEDETIDVNVGGKYVIQGLTDGLLGINGDPDPVPMKVGGKRRISIPPELAYGDDGIPGIVLPGSTLIFEVDLRAVKPAPHDR